MTKLEFDRRVDKIIRLIGMLSADTYNDAISGDKALGYSKAEGWERMRRALDEARLNETSESA